MKRREGRMWAAVTLALAVSVGAGAGAILPGCNGSNDNGGPSMATQFDNVALTLKNGQTVTLNLTGDDGTASGTLVVPSEFHTLEAKRVTFRLPSGTYTVSGKFVPPRSFGVAGTFPAPIGRFSLGGTLPTASEAGNFRIVVNGQSEIGIIPRLASARPLRRQPAP